MTDRQLSQNAVIAAIEGLPPMWSSADAIAAVNALPESLSQYCPNCEQATQALAAADARIAELEAEVARNKDAADYLAERTGRA
jgi:cell division protein FtsB